MGTVLATQPSSLAQLNRFEQAWVFKRKVPKPITRH